MGGVGGVRGRPNTTLYFVALAGILALLAALCCYFLYFCISKVKELTRDDSPLNQPCTNTAAARAAAYPAHKGVRDSATAMAKLCRALPARAAAARTPATAPTSPDAGDWSAAHSADPATDPATDSTIANDVSATATPEKVSPKPMLDS